MATISGIWLFNADPHLQAIEFIEDNINFVSWGKLYNRFVTKYDLNSSHPESFTIIYDNTASGDPYMTAYGWEVWPSVAHRIVDFGETTQEVSSIFYNWLTVNATPWSNDAIIFYDDNTVSLMQDQTATLNCVNKKAIDDITAFFSKTGSISYGNVNQVVDAYKTATLSCYNQKMLNDVIIRAGLVPLAAGTYVINATFNNIMSETPIEAHFNFTSNGKNYSTFTLAPTAGTMPDLTYNTTTVFTGGDGTTTPIWTSGYYKTIKVDNDAFVPVSFVEWFLNNTTKQENIPYWYRATAWEPKSWSFIGTTYDNLPITRYYRKPGFTEWTWYLCNGDTAVRESSYTTQLQKYRYYNQYAMWILSQNGSYTSFTKYDSSFINGKYKCANVTNALIPYGTIRLHTTINGVEYNELIGGTSNWLDNSGTNYQITVQYLDEKGTKVRSHTLLNGDIVDFGDTGQPLPSNIYRTILNNFTEIFNEIKISINDAGGETYTITAASYATIENDAKGLTYVIGEGNANNHSGGSGN